MIFRAIRPEFYLSYKPRLIKIGPELPEIESVNFTIVVLFIVHIFKFKKVNLSECASPLVPPNRWYELILNVRYFNIFLVLYY